MKKERAGNSLLLARMASLLLILSLVIGCSESSEPERKQISAPGAYSGYSSPQYTGYETTSQYVTTFDGTRIAVDVHRPVGGPDQKMPAVLCMTPYHRASVVDGVVSDYMSDPEQPYRTISSYGYVIVVADIRGTGASFGTRYTIYAPEEVLDGNDIVDWIVEQDWNDGNVGMMGQSYLASIQFLNASNRNPHLKCIIPRYSFLEVYDFVYPGGIRNSSFVDYYDILMFFFNLNMKVPMFSIYPSKAVDEDTDGSLLRWATLEHLFNFSMKEQALQVPFRDSTIAPKGVPLRWADLSPSGHLEAIEASGVAIYNMGGWLDCFVRESLSFQNTLSNESKILVGNYDHTQGFSDYAVECVRFFDRYLKGIDNGIDREAPFYIFTSGSDTWRFEDEWPPAGTRNTPYYFEADGVLDTSVPVGAGSDEYKVDYTTSSGEASRWMAMAGIPSEYPDRAEEDKKCLTYTTPPLEQDLEVTGHPVVHLFVSSTAGDLDFFVYLEDIDEEGFVKYVTEGQLRASMRKLSPRPWLPDLPWHRCYQADVQAMPPGEVVEVVIDLYPTSRVFRKGHRVRVSIAGADDGNFSTPLLDPPPTIRMFRGGNSTSYIELPVIE